MACLHQRRTLRRIVNRSSLGILSIRQAATGMACQQKIKPTQPMLSQIDRGRENQRQKSEKQFIIRLPAPLRNLICRFVAGVNSVMLKILMLSFMALQLHSAGVQTEPDLSNSVCVWGRTVKNICPRASVNRGKYRLRLSSNWKCRSPHSAMDTIDRIEFRVWKSR